MATTSQFGLSRYQLQELMSHKGKDGQKRLSEYDGVLGIADLLRSNVKGGLDGVPQDLELRKLEYGANYIAPVPPKSFLALALDAIQDKTLIILIVAALVSIVLGVTVEEQKDIAWIEGAAILAAVVLVVVVTAINDWTKERQFRGLQKKLDTDSRFFVLRDGKTEELPLAEIVVGDVAQFKYGNTFPVDGILIKGFDVKVDESSLTGEAELVKKHPDRDSMLYAGTQVMEGGGTMLVTAVGASSQQGIIFKLMMAQSEDDAGFITLALRRLYRKVMQLCRRSNDTEQGEGGERGVEVQEIPIDPREGKRLTEGSDDSNESDEEEPPLTGCDQCNLFKRVQRKKKQRQQKKKKSEGESSGSGSVLQKKLNKLALQIGYAGTLAALVCILILTIKFAIEEFGIAGRPWNSSTDFSELLHFVIIGVTVLVVAVPEGLPLAVTIALAFSVKKMLKDNNLVRHLHACETMGNATAICSDKTGTLTTNRMTVVESYFAGTKYDVTPRPADLPDKLLDILSTDIAVNSSYTSKLITEEEEDEGSAPKGLMERMLSWRPWGGGKEKGLLGRGLAKQVGNVTECALLGFLVELGIDYQAIREEHPTEIFTKVFTFNSARKSMTTVIPLPGGGYRMLTKGASEIVLKKCTSVLGENGRVLPLSTDDVGNIVNTVVQPMAEGALRTICLAYRDFPVSAGEGEIASSPDWDDEEGVVTDLTFLGIVGIEDPVRPEVPGCIKKCQEAGITVRMVTGDNIDTARSIAEKCGITSKGDKFLVLEGKELNKRIRDDDGQVSEEKLDKVWPWLRVLARSSPQDKYTLVEGIILSRLRKNREVVAVTGDGTNDGPALKRADVGFAMGIAGTDVAKEASDIILTDDNFASIVKAVMWGRNVYDSISKFLQFQLTVNVVAVSLALISAIIITDSPLRAVQMLWVNLIMDTFASLALATEPPTEELLKRKPYGRNKPLLSRHMWLFIAGHSLYQLTVMLVLVFAGDLLFDIDDGKYRELRATPSQHFTLVFNTFVFMQIFNEINARKVHGERNVFKGIHRNWIFLVVVVGQVAVQAVLVQAGGPLGLVFSTTRITADQWLWCLFLGSTELVVGQLLLLIPVHKIPKFWRKGREEVDFEQVPELEDPLEPRTSAKILWVKSLTRIRTQIRVVNAFRSGLESGAVIHLSHLPQFTSTPRASRYNPTPPVTGKETAV